MLDRIQEIFDHLIETWLKVAQYFDGLLSEHDNIFHPEAHSRLLSDDTTFSRSRRYTWAIDCLLAFDVSITDAARQWEEWNKCWITPCLQNPEFEKLEELRFKTVKAGQTVHRLERIRIQVQQSREHATVSREGVYTVFSVELKRSIEANLGLFSSFSTPAQSSKLEPHHALARTSSC
jgi:hypothetical protein